jgi:hypothetical protein
MNILDRIRRDRAIKNFQREQERKNPDYYLKAARAERRKLEKYDEIQKEKSKIAELRKSQDKTKARKIIEGYLASVKARKAKIGVDQAREGQPIGMWAREAQSAEERRNIFIPSGKTPWERYK